jgi:hypothetical protein
MTTTPKRFSVVHRGFVLYASDDYLDAADRAERLSERTVCGETINLVDRQGVYAPQRFWGSVR